MSRIHSCSLRVLRSCGGSQGWQDRQCYHSGEWSQHRDQSGGAQDVLQVRITTVIIIVIIIVIAGWVPGHWRWPTTVTIPGPTRASWTRRAATRCTTASPPSERWDRALGKWNVWPLWQNEIEFIWHLAPGCKCPKKWNVAAHSFFINKFNQETHKLLLAEN